VIAAARVQPPADPAPSQHLVSLWRLWFGLFAAPAAWAIQLISNYALLAHFCFPADKPLAAPTFSGVRVAAITISAALLLVALTALFVANRARHATHSETRNEKGQGERQREREKNGADVGHGRTRFMAMAGILVSGIFIYGILMAGLPLVTMNPCTL
jgi:hypothetical protein